MPARAWFGHYATLFDTVELNTTFYRLPEAHTVETWADQAPPGFVYAVKLGRYGTHRKKLKDPADWLPHHVERLEALGRSAGPTLVQLPPHWHRDPGRLDDLLAIAPSDQRWAVEVRDPSWLHDDVYEVLARHRAGLCLHDLLPHHPWELTADWTYLRFHGPRATDEPYTGRYTGRRLWRTADRLGDLLERGHDVYAYFNNDIGGAAVSDAAWLRDRLRRDGG